MKNFLWNHEIFYGIRIQIFGSWMSMTQLKGPENVGVVLNGSPIAKFDIAVNLCLLKVKSVAQTRNAKNRIDMKRMEKGESFKIALGTVRASLLAQIVSHVQSARSHFQRWPCPNLEPKKNI